MGHLPQVHESLLYSIVFHPSAAIKIQLNYIQIHLKYAHQVKTQIRFISMENTIEKNHNKTMENTGLKIAVQYILKYSCTW